MKEAMKRKLEQAQQVIPDVTPSAPAPTALGRPKINTVQRKNQLSVYFDDDTNARLKSAWHVNELESRQPIAQAAIWHFIHTYMNADNSLTQEGRDILNAYSEAISR